MNEINFSKQQRISKNLINIFEKKYMNPNALLDQQKNKIEVGDIIRIGYLIPEGEKERVQSYEGIIIGIQNKGIGKSFTLRRAVQGVGIEQVFVANSPKIISLIKKQSSHVRRAKLYFLRYLSGKSTRLKRKF
jgi:large subunit ribosomal protein L19